MDGGAKFTHGATNHYGGVALSPTRSTGIKILDWGGVLTDLVSRVNNLEKTRLKWPDFSTKQTLLDLTGDIVPGWDNDSITYASLTIPDDGWLALWAHAENHESSNLTLPDNFYRRRIRVYITPSSNIIACADATSGDFKTHLEDTDCNMVPVKKGNIIRYGNSDTNKEAASPNGAYNRLQMLWFGMLG